MCLPEAEEEVREGTRSSAGFSFSTAPHSRGRGRLHITFQRNNQTRKTASQPMCREERGRGSYTQPGERERERERGREIGSGRGQSTERERERERESDRGRE